MLGAGGVTSIDTKVAAVTVNVVLPVTVSLVADMLVLPTPAVVARPFKAPCVTHRRDATVRRGPRDLCREVMRRVVAIDSGRCELLRGAVGDARRCRCHVYGY